MGGIFCYIGTQKAPPIVIEGLLKLESRDYDSAGICSVERNKTHIRRSKGKLENLSRLIAAVPLWGSIAMGHLRTATHGRASEINAHPHKAGPVVLVHNGTIDNFQELKSLLQSNDHTFKSETDSEVIAHLIEQKMYGGSGFEEAVRAALLELKGTFSLCLVSETEPGMMIVAVHGSPLFVGCAGNEYFIASEMQPVLDHTSEIIVMEDDEMAVINDGLVRISAIQEESVVKTL
ncbi:MAG: class II glutamine amidotransferase [Desulfuromonadales bacterium]